LSNGWILVESKSSYNDGSSGNETNIRYGVWILARIVCEVHGMPETRYRMRKSGRLVEDEFVAIEDAGAASQVGLFSTLMEVPEVPGFGLHQA
jgi:hypothetical protein